MVIAPQFVMVDSFSDGLAAVYVGDPTTGKWGFINKHGEMAISPQFRLTGPFKGGLAAVLIGDFETGQWGFIDMQGMELTMLQAATHLDEGDLNLLAGATP